MFEPLPGKLKQFILTRENTDNSRIHDHGTCVLNIHTITTTKQNKKRKGKKRGGVRAWEKSII